MTLWQVRAVLACTMMAALCLAGEGNPAGGEPDVAVERGMLMEVNELVADGNHEAADARLRSLRDQYPGSIAVQQMHAAVLISLHRYGEAVPLLESMIRDHPDDPRNLNNLAWLLTTAEDPAFRDPGRSLQLAQDAVLLAPGDYHVWNTLAEAHYRKANFQQAVRAMTQALELAGKAPAPEQQIRTYVRQMHDMNEAAMVMSLME